MLGILVSCLAGVVAVDLLHWYGDEMASVHILDKKDVRWQFGYLSESHHFFPKLLILKPFRDNVSVVANWRVALVVSAVVLLTRQPHMLAGWCSAALSVVHHVQCHYPLSSRSVIFKSVLHQLPFIKTPEGHAKHHIDGLNGVAILLWPLDILYDATLPWFGQRHQLPYAVAQGAWTAEVSAINNRLTRERYESAEDVKTVLRCYDAYLKLPLHKEVRRRKTSQYTTPACS